MSYNDLIELVRLCLVRANAARTPAAANELRRMAKGYQARAEALQKDQRPDVADAKPGPSGPAAPLTAISQQQLASDGSEASSTAMSGQQQDAGSTENPSASDTQERS
jgi:hypothetical protein